MIQALMFDMDGVLVDTEPVHEAARQAVYRAYGIPATDVRHIPVKGRNTVSIFTDVNAVHPFPVPLHTAVREKHDLFVRLLEGPIDPLPGIRDLLERYHGRVPIALVSASAHKTVEAVLRSTELETYFPVRVHAGDVRAFKPDPEGYLLAAERVGRPPAACAVFEDSVIGIRAAKAAGARVVGVHTGPYPEDLGEADLAVQTVAAGLVDIVRFLEA